VPKREGCYGARPLQWAFYRWFTRKRTLCSSEKDAIKRDKIRDSARFLETCFDIQQIASPDQRYYLLLASNEMRMSHSVTIAALWERASARLLLQIGDGLWSCEDIVWSTDSRVVTVGLRRYPGDAPGIVLDMYPQQQLVIPHAPDETQPLPFAQLNTF
jgi:hypothetical protein